MAKNRKVPSGWTLDLHALYESAVQSVDADVDFVDETFEKKNGRPPRSLREDFCGTAALAADFVRRRPDNRAWGYDLDQPTLDWGKKHRLAPLGQNAERVQLLCADVRDAGPVPVEAVCAFNFSYFVFKTRTELLSYFEAAYRNLESDGLFFLDTFGGTESMISLEEDNERDEKTDPDGLKVPALVYTWEQEYYNPITAEIRCHITLELEKGAPGGRQRWERAFTYDWRFWTLVEILELLDEAGFASRQVYTEGWDEEDEEGDGDFQPVDEIDNDGSWIAYIVATKS